MGSTIDESVNLITEVAGHAERGVNKLLTWALNNKYLIIHTKVKIYDSCVLLPILMEMRCGLPIPLSSTD